VKLHSFRIKGYRRIHDTIVTFGDATFLIGENNVGKSSVLKALDLFFSDYKPDQEDFLIVDHKDEIRVEKIVLTATFVGVPDEAREWRGFKGRILSFKDNEGQTNAIKYRKTYPLNGKTKYEMREYNRDFKEEYQEAKTLQNLVDLGVSEDKLKEAVNNYSSGRYLTTKEVMDGIRDVDELWEMDRENESWFENPGGIPGNVQIKLPRYLLIPAEDKQDEISHRYGALQKTMNELFESVRDQSANYKNAQKYLDLLAKELDPNDPDREFGKMMEQVNSILKNVFPESELHVDTNLSDPDSSISPSFDIGMSSNVRTSASRQGMGTIRSAVFALLRYREMYLEKAREQEGNYIRPLIIGFEEPEIYLHPNAANNMRDEIYNLAISSNSQIVSTTHSPFMIDLSKDLDDKKIPKQILNLITLDSSISEVTTSVGVSNPFNVTEAFINLKKDEKDFLKMILKMDDYVSRVFFASKIIIIEGDTEEIVLKETLARMPFEVRKDILSRYQIIRARGKASIIALVKYLRALSLDPYVIHDKDEKKGATKFNKPIQEALSSPDQKYVLKNCIEEVLGYDAPSSNKPYQAFKYITKNWTKEDGWIGVQQNWRTICEENLFPDVFLSYKLRNIVSSIVESKSV